MRVTLTIPAGTALPRDGRVYVINDVYPLYAAALPGAPGAAAAVMELRTGVAQRR